MTRTDVEFLVKEIWSGHSEEWIRGWKRCIAKTKIQFKKDDPAEFIKGIMVANRFKVLLGYEATKLLFPVPEEQEETKVEEKPESFPKRERCDIATVRDSAGLTKKKRPREAAQSIHS